MSAPSRLVETPWTMSARPAVCMASMQILSNCVSPPVNSYSTPFPFSTPSLSLFPAPLLELTSAATWPLPCESSCAVGQQLLRSMFEELVLDLAVQACMAFQLSKTKAWPDLSTSSNLPQLCADLSIWHHCREMHGNPKDLLALNLLLNPKLI